MSVWRVFTDGCAAMGEQAERGSRHPGGWAGVIEHGSDGFVVRGREPSTTNTRMELVAVIRSLESLPAFQDVHLHTDCSAVLTVKERHARGILAQSLGKDGDLWLAVADQFDRMLHVRVIPIPKGGDPRHRRAHVIAGTEARAMQRGLPPDATVLSPQERRAMLHATRALHRQGPTSVEQAFREARRRTG